LQNNKEVAFHWFSIYRLTKSVEKHGQYNQMGVVMQYAPLKLTRLFYGWFGCQEFAEYKCRLWLLLPMGCGTGSSSWPHIARLQMACTLPGRPLLQKARTTV
jgi:hypothetical protein